MTRYENMSVTAAVDRAGDLLWCPTPGCGYAFVFGDSKFDCPMCTKIYCLACRVEYHEDKTCKEFSARRDGELRLRRISTIENELYIADSTFRTLSKEFKKEKSFFKSILGKN